MTNLPEIDSTNCDKEPIQFLGKIQPHGFLFCLSKKTHKITHVSANIGRFVRLTAGDVLGKKAAVLNPFIQAAD